MGNASDGAAPPGTLVSWDYGTDDAHKYVIVHVSPDGITLVRKLKNVAAWQETMVRATRFPEQARAILQQMPKAVQLARDDLIRVTWVQDLEQLTLFDQNGKKFRLPEGKAQAEVFEAIKQHLGGVASEEETDAWSVMQPHLVILLCGGLIGAVLIAFTAMCKPDFKPDGPGAAVKIVLNWIGYKIGPFWMSVIVASLEALVFGMMILMLISRPIRHSLSFSR